MKTTTQQCEKHEKTSEARHLGRANDEPAVSPMRPNDGRVPLGSESAVEGARNSINLWVMTRRQVYGQDDIVRKRKEVQPETLSRGENRVVKGSDNSAFLRNTILYKKCKLEGRHTKKRGES